MKNSKKNIKNYNNISKGKYFCKLVAYILGLTTYMFAHFYRVNTTVLAPYLAETFKVSSTSLGLMSSIYFYSYASLQPVIGVLTDRWKPRKMLTVFILIMTLGALIYAYSPIFMFTYIGRLLIGIGSAGVMIPVSWVITNYFTTDKRGFLFAIFVFSGSIGSLLAASPFAKLINLFGWRSTLVKVAFISFGLAVLVWFFVRDNNSNKIEETHLDNRDIENIIKNDEEKVGWFTVYKEVLSMPIIKYCLIAHLAYAAMISFQGLWAVLFFMDVYKMGKSIASDLMTMIPIGLVVGVLSLSKLNDTRYGKYVCFFVNAVSAAVYLVFTILTIQMPHTLLIILLFLIGFSVSAIPYLFKIFSSVLPKRYYGTAMGIINVFPILACALYQSFTGLLFDLFGGGADVLYRTVGSYKLYFLFLTLSLIIATLANLKIINILNKDYKGKI